MTDINECAISPKYELEQYVSKKITLIQKLYLSKGGNSNASRTLAMLRRAVSKNPGSIPDTWVVEFEGMPNSLVGRGENPSRGEWAIHGAMTLYAVHQQSLKVPMYQSGREYDLGASVRKLMQCENKNNVPEGESKLPRRFSALMTVDSLSETLYYARQLMHQLRSCSIPLDYARFAGQLYDIQNPYKADSVKLAWGRSFEYSGTINSTK
jgi:CRISPR system Cascade subunit CasB